MEMWTLNYASADHKNISVGCSIFFTEHDAIEALREDILDRALDDLDLWDDDALEKAQDETKARIAKLTFDELATIYEEQFSDALQTVQIQHHADVTPPAPVPTTPEEIEAFLNDQPAPAPSESDDDDDDEHCRGCGRDELTCSLNPCPDVIADRES